MKTYTYYGHMIYFDPQPGYKLPYSSYIDGLFRYADTLAGMKRMIREYIQLEEN